MCLTATLITDAQAIYTLEIGKYYRHVETDGVYLSSINGTFPNITPTQFPILASGIVAVPCPNLVTDTNAILTPCDANPEINQKWTLCYNEGTNKFTSFYTRYPRLYMNLSGDRLLAQYPSDGTNAFIPNIFTLGKDAQARNAFWGFNEIVNTSYLIFAINKDKDITKLPSHLIMNSNRLWTTLELVNTEQFDSYGGAVGIRGRMPMNILGEPRGGKWFVPYPEGTDVLRDGVWNNQQILTRISGEQLLVKLTCNETLFVGGQPDTVLDDFFVVDRSLYELFDVTSFFTASKKNS
jgi:hypothetical protein